LEAKLKKNLFERPFQHQPHNSASYPDCQIICNFALCQIHPSWIILEMSITNVKTATWEVSNPIHKCTYQESVITLYHNIAITLMRLTVCNKQNHYLLCFKVSNRHLKDTVQCPCLNKKKQSTVHQLCTFKQSIER